MLEPAKAGREPSMQYRFDTAINPATWSFIELSEDGGLSFPKRLTKEMITFDTAGREDIHVNVYGVVHFYDRDTARRILRVPGKTIFELQEFDRIPHHRTWDEGHEELLETGKSAPRPRC